MMNQLDPETRLNTEIGRDGKEDHVMMGVAHFTNMERQLSSTPFCLAIMGQINILANEGSLNNDFTFC